MNAGGHLQVWKKAGSIWLASCGAGCFFFLAGVVRAEVDVYRITEEVLIRDVPRFSMNYEQPPFAPWSVDQRINAWNLFYNLEPIVEQYYGRLDDGGEDWAEHTTRPGFSHWDSAKSGYWDGAEMRVYRLKEGVLSHVRTATVKRSDLQPRCPETRELGRQWVQLSEPGPSLKPGDFYMLRIERDAPSQNVRPELIGSTGIPRLDRTGEFEGTLTWRFDRAHPSPGGGLTSLRMDITEAGPDAPAGPWHWFMVQNDDEPHIHLRFRPGKPYRFSVWLKQEGMQDPRVRIQIGVFRVETVEVGSEWKEFVFDIPVENPLMPLPHRQNLDSRLFIGALSPGTLWMDRMLVWQTDVEPFAVLPEYVERLRAFRPHTLRLWGGYIAPSLAYWLGEGHRQLAIGEMGRSGRPVVLPLHRSLQLCEEVGADPWLILNPLYSEEEHHQLMEYLAGPSSTPMGRVRAELGREAPWTTAFRTIYLESSNESWNRIMRYEWHGLPEIYAAIADRQFRECKASPYFDERQFEFILNGWDTQLDAGGWTPRVMQASKEGHRIDLAGYFGGWEEGAVPVVTVEGSVSEVIQDKLLATPVQFGRKLAQTLSLATHADQRLFDMLYRYPNRWTILESLLPAPARSWPDAWVQPPAEGSVGERIRALWSLDAEAGPRQTAAILHRVAVLERGFWSMAFHAMGENEALQPVVARRLRVPAGMPLDALCAGLSSHQAPDVLQPLLLEHPGMIANWLADADLPARVQDDLRRFLEENKTLSYNITNPWRRALEDAIREVLVSEQREHLVDELHQRSSAATLRSWIRDLERSSQSLLREATERQAQQLMAAMRADPAFARDVFGWLHAHPDWLQKETETIAHRLVKEMVRLLASPKELAAHQALLTPQLPAGDRLRLLNDLQESVRLFSGDLGADGRLLIPPLLEAVKGEPGALASLEQDPLFTGRVSALFYENMNRPLWQLAEDHARVGEVLARSGLILRADEGIGLAVYEGGPGYALPGPGIAPPEADENLGKSLALGTATLDLYLSYLMHGASPLAYYKFRSGAYWSTHNDPVDGIPYPSWLSLKLFNNEVRGDMLAVYPRSVQTVDVPDKDIRVTTNDGRGRVRRLAGRQAVALTVCHAFRDGERYALVLLNRDATQARTLQFEFPFNEGKAARLWTMTHADPAAHNRHEAQVTLQEQRAPEMRTGTHITVPPASVLVWIGDEGDH